MKSFLSNPRAILLLVAVIIVSGLVAFNTLPRAEDPHIGNRTAFALTSFAGASASRVETLITEPLENKLREMPEIDYISSNSSAGLSVVTISLKDSVSFDATEDLWAEVRDKLSEASKQLPEGAGEPILDDQRAYGFTMIFALRWQQQYADADLLVLGRYAEELASRLRNVEGTDYIKITGAPEEEILVDVDISKTSLSGLRFTDVVSAVSTSDAKVAAGELHNRYQRMSVEVEGGFDTLGRIRAIPLRNNDNSSFQLSEIANVTRQPKMPMSTLAIIDGEPAVVVGVRMLPDQRGDLWSARIKEALADSERILPSSLFVDIIFDQQVYTDFRLHNLAENIVIGFSLIVAVLLLTLGWRSALIVALSLPLTILFAFSCMRFVGLPIEQMSVTGLIVALGIMVDNAIVMVDTVDRYKRRGYSGLQATFNAVAHLWKPLLGSTLTTILTFMPIAALEGSSGEFIGGIAITVIASLVGSYLISHLIVAGFAGRLLKLNAGEHWINEGVQLPVIAPIFKRSILWGIENPKKIIALVSIFPLLGFYFGSQLPESFFPPSDRDMINFEVYLPSSSSIDQTQALTEKITKSVQQEEGIKRLHWFIGGNSPSFYYNLMQRRDNAQNYAQAMLTADNFEMANQLVPLLQKKLDDEFPEAQIIIRRLEQGPPFNAPVEVRLTGDSFDVLKEQGEELRRRFLAIEDVIHIRSTLGDAAPKLWLALDENKVAKAGLTLVAAADELQRGIDGVVAGSILEQNQSLPVRVQSFTAKRGDIELVNSWLLSPGLRPTGVPATGVPIAALGEVKIEPALSSIPRRDGRRVNTIEVYIRDGVLPAVVLNRIKQQLENDPLNLPAGFDLAYGGEEAERDSAVGGLLATIGPLLVLLVIAVVMSFNSFRISGIVFVVAFQSAGLGMLALSFSGWPFGFTSIIGLMGLIGLAINAAIIILAELKSNADATRGDSHVIVQCVLNCSRHIVSTTITTVMGFMPLLLDGGAFWPPFAVVIAGGTVLATMLSFYFVPVVFSLMTKHRQFDVVDVEYGAELAAA